MGESMFLVKVIQYNMIQGGEFFKIPAVMITLKNMDTMEVFPHSITHFIYKHYHRKSGSLNSELAVAYVIVPFLNFVLDSVKLGKKEFENIRGIGELTDQHADLYMQSCVLKKANKKLTLNKKEDYLSKFYKYLEDEGVLKRKVNFIVSVIIIDGEAKEVYKINFNYKKPHENLIREKIKRKDIVPQSHISNEDRGRIRLNYIYEFLLLAKHETPDIAFGVAIEIFGGIRRGGLVNLVTSALKPQNGSSYGEKGLIIEVRDRQESLFKRVNNTAKEQVKNPRDQSCLVDPILCYLYKHHMEVVLEKVKRSQYSNALFFDNNGNPMSGDAFDKRFLKLKNTYIGMLLGTKGRYQDYLDFSETKWRSHIGRGAFTNMCLDAGYSAKQTAVLRGDKSTKPMDNYFDVISTTYNISKALKLLSPDLSASLENLNMPFHRKYWKDVEEFARRI